MYESFRELVRSFYHTEGIIPLHQPCFIGQEQQTVNLALESGFVSSIGPEVEHFEELVEEFTGAKYAIATSSGTSALASSFFCLLKFRIGINLSPHPFAVKNTSINLNNFVTFH